MHVILTGYCWIQPVLTKYLLTWSSKWYLKSLVWVHGHTNHVLLLLQWHNVGVGYTLCFLFQPVTSLSASLAVVISASTLCNLKHLHLISHCSPLLLTLAFHWVLTSGLKALAVGNQTPLHHIQVEEACLLCVIYHIIASSLQKCNMYHQGTVFGIYKQPFPCLVLLSFLKSFC